MNSCFLRLVGAIICIGLQAAGNSASAQRQPIREKVAAHFERLCLLENAPTLSMRSTATAADLHVSDAMREATAKICKAQAERSAEKFALSSYSERHTQLVDACIPTRIPPVRRYDERARYGAWEACKNDALARHDSFFE